MRSSSLNAEVNAFARLQMVRGWNSSYFGSKLLIAELFANNGQSCRIHCEQSSAICEWLTAPGDWIKASGPPILLTSDRGCLVCLCQAALMFAQSGEERDPCRHSLALAEKAMSHHEWITMRVARPSCLLRFECFIPDYSQIALNDSQIILRLTEADAYGYGKRGKP
jgi:hypothetical protein